MVKKCRMKKNNLVFVILSLFILAFALLGTLFWYNFITTNEVVQEPKVSVATIFGCLETETLVKDWDNKQAFSRNILGYELVRCN